MSAVTPRTSRAGLRRPWLFALPSARLPEVVTCGGEVYDLMETFKHDFFAATGLYRGRDELVVLKIGRTSDLFTFPMEWVGRLLCRREVRLYERARGLPGVPRLIGTVGPTGFLHEFVPGHPLRRRERVGDRFFEELVAIVRALHERHIAYVDLNKRENILVGDDGRPYLVDFQISLWLPPVGWRRLWPVRWLLRRFQQADLYHCLKHKRRSRPDLLTGDEARRVGRLSIWIHLHRWLTRPLTNLRRAALRRLEANGSQPVPGSSAK